MAAPGRGAKEEGKRKEGERHEAQHRHCLWKQKPVKSPSQRRASVTRERAAADGGGRGSAEQRKERERGGERKEREEERARVGRVVSAVRWQPPLFPSAPRLLAFPRPRPPRAGLPKGGEGDGRRGKRAEGEGKRPMQSSVAAWRSCPAAEW